jgi:hypothetical protein
MSEQGPAAQSPSATTITTLDRRRPLYGIFMLIGLVVGALLVLAAVTASRSSANPSPTSTTPSTTSATSTPTSAATPAAATFEQQVTSILKGHVPSTISTTCQPGDDHQAQSFAIASVVCSATSGGAPITVQYSWFHDGKAQRALFGYDEHTVGVETRAPDLASCGHASVHGGWWMQEKNNAAGDSPHSVTPKADATHGAALCYQQGSLAYIEWYDNDTRIYAWASTQRQLAPELFSWWESSAGPWHPPMDMAKAMAPGADMGSGMTATPSPSMSPSMSPSPSTSHSPSPSMSTGM